MSLDLSGNGVASNEEILDSAKRMFAEIRSFTSPKDACVALAIVHAQFLKACFTPEYRSQCFDALDAHSKIVKEMFSGGLN